MREGVIYKLNIGKYFIIGSSIQPRQRKNRHLSDLRRNRHGNPFVQDVYNTHLNEEVTFEIIKENIPEDILTSIEDIYIGIKCARVEDNKGGMNIKMASRPEHSEETKKRIGLASKGRFVSQETRDKISKANKGNKYPYRKRSIEAIEKTATALRGRKREPMSIKQRRKLSEINKNRSFDLQEKMNKSCVEVKGIKILQYDLKDAFIKEWKSYAELKKGGFHKNTLKRKIKLKIPFKGYIWKLKNDLQ